MKRALPVVLLVLIIAAVAVVLALRASSRVPEVPAFVPVLMPSLHAFNDAGVEVPSGTLLVVAGDPFDLRINVEANAYVYLFDQTQGQTTLMWKHSTPEPWEKGEYSAEDPSFDGMGEHQLLVVASPTPITTVDTWRVLTPESIRQPCPQCEVGSYSFYVTDSADAGSR